MGRPKTMRLRIGALLCGELSPSLSMLDTVDASLRRSAGCSGWPIPLTLLHRRAWNRHAHDPYMFVQETIDFPCTLRQHHLALELNRPMLPTPPNSPSTWKGSMCELCDSLWIRFQIFLFRVAPLDNRHG